MIPSDAVSSKKNAATFECDKCEKSYQSKKSLNRHIQSSHEITKEDVSVEVPVKINKKKNEGLGLASTICNICERFFITKEALESHTSEKHNDQVADRPLRRLHAGAAGRDCTHAVGARKVG